MSAARLALAGCAVLVRTVGAVRAPSAASLVGTDLLVRTADSCDVPGAWRVLGSKAFQAEWLMQTGSRGDTPLMAAAGAGCAELVALLLLHPDLDDKTIRKKRLRKALVEHAMKTGEGAKPKVIWSLVVLTSVLDAKIRQALEQGLSAQKSTWFVPKPGEWMPPATLEEIGVARSKPYWDLDGFLSDHNAEWAMAKDMQGRIVRLVDFDKLWHLLTAFLRSPVATEQREFLFRQIRSIGWSLFFWGGNRALLTHMSLVKDVAQGIPLELPPGVHEHLLAEGHNSTEVYYHMGDALGRLWNRTGDWIAD